LQINKQEALPLVNIQTRLSEMESQKKDKYATRQSQEIVSPKPELHLHPVMIAERGNRSNYPKVAVRAVNNKT